MNFPDVQGCPNARQQQPNWFGRQATVSAGLSSRRPRLATRQGPEVRRSTRQSCFSKRLTSLFATRHSPCLFEGVCRHVIQIARLRRQVWPQSDDLSVVAAGAFKRTNIEAGWRAHQPREVHGSIAFWARPAARRRRGKHELRDEFRYPPSGSRELKLAQNNQAVRWRHQGHGAKISTD